ncbi:MAG: ABC transporter permease [Gemmatimonadota bacterium]
MNLSRSIRQAARGGGLPVVAVLVGLVILAMGLEAAGYSAADGLGALWRGSFGSWYAISSATLPRAVPLLFIGAGLTLAFRAGAFNIGAEGQFYAGAIAATWIGLHVGGWPAPLALIVVGAGALLAGAAWCVIPTILRVRFGVLEVISTLLLNFVATALVSFMVTGPLQESRRVYPQSDPIAAAARLPLLPGTRLHLGLPIAVVVCMALWLLYTRTRWGFRLRALGAGPRAAMITGRVPAGRYLAVALLGSAALAGLAGGIEISGVSYALFQNLSPGYGFTAIAAALLARLNPIGLLATSLLFAALEAGAGAMQRDAGIPSVVVSVVEAVILIVVVVADRWRGPGAGGSNQ